MSKSLNAVPSSFAACGVHQRIWPPRFGRQQEAAEGVERGARAVRHARIGEMHANARQQLVGHDRLGDVVDAAGLQALDDVLGLAQAGHEDHRHMRQRLVLLQAAAGLETVHARHHGVHQDHVGRDRSHDRQRLLALERDQHGHAGLLERVGQHAQRVGRVVDHEHDIAGLLLTHGRPLHG